MAEGWLPSTGTDLVDVVREILRQSPEPLTLAKIRERLPAPFRTMHIAELTEAVQRQVAAHVLVICPKYRSAQDRYWDRPLHEHAKVVLREALAGGLMAWADLRKKFPKYMRHLAESVLNEELACGAIHRHPATSPRMGPRFALEPADVRTYAAKEMHALRARLEQCGFAWAETRETLMQLLQEDEWAEAAARKPLETTVPVRSDWWEKTMS